MIICLIMPMASQVCGQKTFSSEFEDLAKQISDRPQWNNERLEKEVFRREALIIESDKTPADIILRRTEALIIDLQKMKNGPKLEAEAKELDTLKTLNNPGMTPIQQKELFGRITALRRKIAFQNPLLDFDRIIFIKHNRTRRGDNHMIDQYLGLNAEARGGIYLLENPFSDDAKHISLLADVPVSNGRLKDKLLEDAGSFISLDLDYDANEILFAYTEAVNCGYPQKNTDWRTWDYWPQESAYHVFNAKIEEKDGRTALSELKMLTDGRHNDFDACFLPSGRIVFMSERIGGNVRCGARMCPTYTLHAMMRDGSDIIPLSWHETNEWHPSVDNNGMIVYTRWDYVDRDSDIAHHIWHCFPDGRDPRSYHGNYPAVREMRPWMEQSIRAIPESHLYICTASPHHGQAYGTLMIIDLQKNDDRAMSQLKRITPEICMPESEIAPGIPKYNKQTKTAEVYGNPWPLNENYYICVYDSKASIHGIYLVDSFGNKELLYQDPTIGCIDPIPLKPRKRPPAIPVRTTQAMADRISGEDLSEGVVTIMNIYEGEFPFPEGTKIKELRIVNIFSKCNPDLDEPTIGHAHQSVARGVLGTVPVEEDGSAHFKMPTGAPVYFQVLDENGLCVMNMRSDTYLHPGETMGCIGCHEPKSDTPRNVGTKTPMAMKRAPSKIKPEDEGSYPLTFPRLVQPVLDKKCVGCHGDDAKRQEASAKTGKKVPFGLRGDVFGQYGWSEAMLSLNNYAWGMHGGNGTGLKRNKRSYSIPGKDGARVSKLYNILSKGHHNVMLTDEEMRRITLWLDCNSNFYGSYLDCEKQAKGEVVKPRWSLPAWKKFEDLVQ